MIQGMLLWVFGVIWVLIHPFHVSICEIKHQEKEKSLEISCRMFQDDLEVALGKRTNVDNYFDNKAKHLINKDLESFLHEKLKITLNGAEHKPGYLGYEIEDGVVWCYLEMDKVKSIKEISVEYSVLFDTFEDQFNLVHFKYQGKVKSFRLHKENVSGSVSF